MMAWCYGERSMMNRLQLWLQRLQELVHDLFENSPIPSDSRIKVKERRPLAHYPSGPLKSYASSTLSPALHSGWRIGRWWWTLQGSVLQSCCLFGLVTASILILGQELTEQLAHQIRDLRPF